MKFSAVLAVASMAIGQAAAGILNHRHFHMPREAKPVVSVPEKYVLPYTAALIRTNDA